jgi:hypothetical protein
MRAILPQRWRSVHQQSQLQYQSDQQPQLQTNHQDVRNLQAHWFVSHLPILARSLPAFMFMLQILTYIYRARRHEGRRNSRPACRHWRYNFPPDSIPDRYLSTSTVTIKHKPNFSNRVRRRQSRPCRSWQARRTQLRIWK